MTRPCTVCTHVDRDVIDAALVGQAPYRRIAAHHDLAEASVRRHATSHIPVTLAHAAEAAEIGRADVLLAQVDALRSQALELLDEARESGDIRTALTAIGQIRGVLELLARLTGELSTETTVNIVVSAEWTELRTLVVQTLEPWPDARAALAGALTEVGA